MELVTRGTNPVVKPMQRQHQRNNPNLSFIISFSGKRLIQKLQSISEIANLFDSNGVDLEEFSVICGNTLEETRGREYEIATDGIISHACKLCLKDVLSQIGVGAASHVASF